MQFDLSDLAIHCVSPLEPAFLAALLVGTFGAIVAARALGRLNGHLVRQRRGAMWVVVVWSISGFAMLAAPIALLHVLYPLSHPRGSLCTAFVWPAFLVPPVVLFVLGVRSKRVDKQANAPG